MKHSLQIFREMDSVLDNGAKMLPPWLSLGVKVPKHKLWDPKGNLDKLSIVTSITLPFSP
jgi:hypothetical protein